MECAEELTAQDSCTCSPQLKSQLWEVNKQLKSFLSLNIKAKEMLKKLRNSKVESQTDMMNRDLLTIPLANYGTTVLSKPITSGEFLVLV